MLGAKVIARAKINLFLEVGDLRDDGFHEVRSVMQSLELSDELYFRRTDGSAGRVVIRCNDPDVPGSPDNLIWKAHDEFESQFGPCEGGLEVFLNKRIPVGAGLAGGSADAAATVLAMNHMLELDLERESLLEVAERVGSDVPFCLVGGTALVSGRGETVEALPPLPPFQVVLAGTGETVSTREVYGRFDELGPGDLAPREETGEALELMLLSIRAHDFEKLYASLRNTLEPATLAREQVGVFKDVAMEAGATAALMTGSGPTVFALVSGMEQAAEVAWELEKVAPVTIITSFAEQGAELAG